MSTYSKEEEFKYSMKTNNLWNDSKTYVLIQYKHQKLKHNTTHPFPKKKLKPWNIFSLFLKKTTASVDAAFKGVAIYVNVCGIGRMTIWKVRKSSIFHEMLKLCNKLSSKLCKWIPGIMVILYLLILRENLSLTFLLHFYIFLEHRIYFRSPDYKAIDTN